MIALILSIGLGTGIIVLLNYPFFGDDDFFLIETPVENSRPRNIPSTAALPFEEFCARKCGHRYVCIRKQARRKAGKCLEYELKTAALR